MDIKSQAATEYLMIIGFVVVLLLPGIYLYIQYSQESKDSIVNAKVDAITNEIISAAEQVYSYGEGSQTSVVVDFPEDIVAINFQEKEIVFTVVNSKGSQSEIAKVANINLEGKITIIPGTKKINVKSLGSSVSVFVECSQNENRCGSEAECDYYIDNYEEGMGCSLTCQNNKWDIEEICYNGCSEGLCNACQDGQKACSTELTICGGAESCVVVCYSGAWEFYYGCDLPLCVGGNCGCEELGSTKCSTLPECNNEQECVITCNPGGPVWQETMACVEPFTVCEEGQMEELAHCVEGGGGT